MIGGENIEGVADRGPYASRNRTLEKSGRFGHDAPQIRLSERFAQKRKSPTISRAACQQDHRQFGPKTTRAFC
ncbi:MAG: hypothetical protein WAL37_13875 [Xanthobacteraceae bacterium]